jgi:hypothetical protein
VIELDSRSPIPIPPIGSFIQAFKTDQHGQFNVVWRVSTDFQPVNPASSANRWVQVTVIETFPPNVMTANAPDSIASQLSLMNLAGPPAK